MPAGSAAGRETSEGTGAGTDGHADADAGAVTGKGAGRRRFCNGRVLGITALVLVTLADGGHLAKPLWQPWWYGATLCGGHVAGGDLAALLPKEQLRAGTESWDTADGVLRCAIDRGRRPFRSGGRGADRSRGR
ncbi:hypothetical protein [Streptomyces sp. NPDC059786]|uniref:hypothetical protein n=1 Tax=Streptomyces sp. NPDC059786 TaxID=3346946 RepID=UPI00365DF2F5